MGAVVREGDFTAGTEGFNPTSVPQNASTGTQAAVFANGIGVVCQGDPFIPHTNGTDTHAPGAGVSGKNVFVGPARKELFTDDSLMNAGCGDTMAPIVGTVFAG